MINFDRSFYLILFFSVVFGVGVLSCDEAIQESKNMENIESQDNYYTEQYRNQYHFSPEANWMNDPNGMVYYEGEYHLFYQYYPDSTVWGPMHWGHAVSKDMVHWEHLPIALYPDSLGYIFSGSAVIDWQNTSGLGKDGQTPMIAIFTHHDIEGEKSGGNQYQYQSIAYSNDKGRTWEKYDGNPVIENPGIKDFRDPKVIWHPESERWIMVFAVYDKVQIYTSPDLKDWSFASEFGISGDQRLWECPDLFPMKVEESGETKWVLITSIQQEGPNGGTATGYFIGDFDGKNFLGNPAEQYWLDYGKDNYALVTWSDVQKTDGRILALGWMSNWQYAQVVPSEKWRSAMTLPRSLSLHKTADSYQLRSKPVVELSILESGKTNLASKTYEHLETLIEGEHTLYKIELSFKKPTSSSIGLRLSNPQGAYTDILFDGVGEQYLIDRTNSGITDFSEDFPGIHAGPAHINGETVDMLIYLDHASIELFADEGQCAMTEIVFPEIPYTTISLVGEKEPVTLLQGSITKLKSIWN